MSSFARADTSILGRWWWTVDRWTLAALAVLMGIGAVLILAASPAVSERIGLGSFSLAKRQLVLLPLAGACLLGTSLLSVAWVRRLGVLGLLGTLMLLVATLAIGPEIKGAQRWINLVGFSLQPSEFLKPFFAVTCAWLFALGKSQQNFPGTALAMALFGLFATLLLAQPDLGQTFVLGVIFGVQFFLAGVPMVLVIALGICGLVGLIGAYAFLPHVTERIDLFLDPAAGDSFQIDRSLEAFVHGGLWGVGPGEGRVKAVLPDAHADFVFAVAGEELGLVICLLIVAVYGFVVLRGFARLLGESSLFVLLAATGLLTQFGLQALINMGSALRLIPTKGMTLPFISYGGSSLLALAVGMGLLLALTRRRFATGDET
ncbi:FtsW/RodA/SpoVE family cell cycle protein [Algihabitans albus]|uniref:FtsW/RodA/SpoVE family cell cycle protein n=1 Tax=Algihabitans albus TaxID=2164067 RepID=UPI000E5D0A8D|nr:putative peptidoglycan glycosyltransferase FtsW [Algihabitans albus]